MALEVTDKYPCIVCGCKESNIIRPGDDPRIKCKECGFTYNASDAVAVASIGPSSSETLATAKEPEVIHIGGTIGTVTPSTNLSTKLVPKNPAYVFIDKKSSQVEFCTKRDFKKTAINWSQSDFSVYELKPIKLNVKIDIKQYGNE